MAVMNGDSEEGNGCICVNGGVMMVIIGSGGGECGSLSWVMI